MANGDLFFSATRKFGDEGRDAIVQREFAALPQLRNRNRSDRLHRAEPPVDRIAGHGHAKAGFADGVVEQWLAVERDEDLCAQVQPLVDAAFQNIESSLHLCRVGIAHLFANKVGDAHPTRSSKGFHRFNRAGLMFRGLGGHEKGQDELNHREDDHRSEDPFQAG